MEETRIEKKSKTILNKVEFSLCITFFRQLNNVVESYEINKIEQIVEIDTPKISETVIFIFF